MSETFEPGNEPVPHKPYDAVELVEVSYELWPWDADFQHSRGVPRQAVLLEYAEMGFGVASTVVFTDPNSGRVRLLDTFVRVERMH